jgi:hypothetical protein
VTETAACYDLAILDFKMYTGEAKATNICLRDWDTR